MIGNTVEKLTLSCLFSAGALCMLVTCHSELLGLWAEKANFGYAASEQESFQLAEPPMQRHGGGVW